MTAERSPGDAPARRYPRYLELFERGAVRERAERARRMLAPCRLCPRDCGVNRLEDERGTCGIGERAVVSGVHPHFGEEAPLVGRRGSGTIFFSGCNLKCIFCQNYEISQEGVGRAVTAAELASMMLGLQELGCHNLNLVTPTHVVPQILESLETAVERGFTLPIVYNSGGYDSPEGLALLDGIVDIYMPDLKYQSSDMAERYSNARDYPAVAAAAVREMHRQVGDLVVSSDGVAITGLLVRHLVMPGSADNTVRVLRFLADEISHDTYVNVMRQYHPCYRACAHPPLDRSLTLAEWRGAIRAARESGLHRLDKE
jgi:putative pyruvate formate lyase activating enzyme